MKKEFFKINNIPAVIWGEKKNNIIIAVHGSSSSKTDIPIEILAQEAIKKGYQVLSFDLPEHGERKSDGVLCKVQFCVEELYQVMQFVKKGWSDISLFANSIGAYFSLLAYKNEPIKRAWFLSPVVDMERIINNMMTWFEVTESELKHTQTIPTPIGQTLYWDYYCFVKENPIIEWSCPTFILYGDKDDMCEFDTILNFEKNFKCQLKIVKDCEHYFHTPYQLNSYKEWLIDTM